MKASNPGTDNQPVDIFSGPLHTDAACDLQLGIAADVLANSGDMSGSYGGFSPGISKQIASHHISALINHCAVSGVVHHPTAPTLSQQAQQDPQGTLSWILILLTIIGIIRSGV